MAFILTPRFAPAYQAPQCNPFGFCAPVSRSPYSYRVSRPQPRRPHYFFSQVDELLSEIDREAKRQAQLEAQREAERAAQLEAQRQAQRQQEVERMRALRAEFEVNQNEKGWQIDGHIQGFDQENISVEMVDERTLKIAGNTHWQSEKAQPELQQPQIEAAPAIEQASTEHEVENATETETTTAGAATPDSDTASHKSYQATVEDDFEDLGDDATSSVSSSSSSSSTAAEPKEPKGKEKAVDEPTSTETVIVPQPQPEVQSQESQAQSQQQKRVHGSFERTLRFPESIDVANVSASFKDGVLSVTVPRAQASQVRKIAIL